VQPKNGPVKAGTLVVCPLIAMTQWRTEIEKFVKPNSLSVLTYHGPSREKFDALTLSKYDVILTTYQTIEQDARKMTNPNKVACPNCGNKYQPDKLKQHLQYFCGESAERTEAQSKQVRGGGWGGKKAKSFPVTKTIPPKMMPPKTMPAKTMPPKKVSGKAKLLQQLKEFPKAKTKSGKRKKFDSESDAIFSSEDDFSDDDEMTDKPRALPVVDIAKLTKNAMKGAKTSPLHALVFWRIVLDEAHMIKTRSSSTAKAACMLSACHRWCLSGTPLQVSRAHMPLSTPHVCTTPLYAFSHTLLSLVQNRVSEIYSQIRFLRVTPMGQYFCKADKGTCKCKSLHYAFTDSRCDQCGHSSMQHWAYFNKFVMNPIQRSGFIGDGRQGLLVLKKEFLDKFVLRRTKANKEAELALPPRLVEIKYVQLHPIEEDFYSSLYTQGRTQFDEYTASGTLLNNYAHIFDLLMRMRQTVNHPYLVLHSARAIELREQQVSHAREHVTHTSRWSPSMVPPMAELIRRCA